MVCAAYVRGLQGNHSKYTRISATVKHYALYSGPECDHAGGCTSLPAGLNRVNFNAVVSVQDIMQTYLPMFKWAVAPVAAGGGGALSVMSSFSHVNNIAMPNNSWLQNDVLRKRLGFGEGLIVTDWGSIANFEKHDPFVPHQPACGNKSCVAMRAGMALKAGTDMDLRGGYGQPLADAVAEGFATMADVDTALRRSLTIRFLLGMFDPPQLNPYRQIPFSVIGSAAHRAVALEAAEKALILLHNERGALPVDPALYASGVKKVAMIGPAADASYGAAYKLYTGDYASCERCSSNWTVTPAQGIASYISGLSGGAHNGTLHAEGCNVACNSTEGFAEAVALASRDDVGVVVLVLAMPYEGEGADRVDQGLGLPGHQAALIEQVTAAANAPVVLVLVHGGAISIPRQLLQPTTATMTAPAASASASAAATAAAARFCRRAPNKLQAFLLYTSYMR
jgi:beta-glucosidase-like glycosyl hydrolase